MAFLDKNGGYYEGDGLPGDTEVPKRPSVTHEWNGTSWVAGALARAVAWGAIKAERDRRKAGGVKVGDKWFHSDDGSRIQQMTLAMMGANIPAGLQWKTLDGSFITMTSAIAQSVFATVAASDQAIFAAAEAHRLAMTASPDPASYDYSGGWPKVYGE